MRHWAQAELSSTPPGCSSGKRRTRAIESKSLQELSANNLRILDCLPEENDAPPVRLSRHIPQREGMDMAVSSYNLTTSRKTNAIMASVSTGVAGMGGGGGVGVGASSGALSLPNSTVTSYSSAFSESFVSDDSSYMTSIYNEVLADQLSSENAQRHRKIGGEVLRFDNTEGVYNRIGLFQSGRPAGVGAGDSVPLRGGENEKPHGRSIAASGIYKCASSSFLSLSAGSALLRRFKTAKPTSQRVLFTNPERVLDAPDFPSEAKQLLHWGSNNKLIIGLKNCLYGWDSDTAQASRMIQLQESINIYAVHWLHKCTCVALALDEGVTAIYDCRREEFLRTVRVEPFSNTVFTYLAVNGPLLSIGTNTSCGGIYTFDLRAKRALTAVYEGHTSGIASLSYCTKEPFYLASGSADGAVRVWDARRNCSPRYAFDRVHNGPVNSILWNPDKRSKMYTCGQDGMLCCVDTHAPMTNVTPAMRGDEDEPDTDAHFITQAINTLHPISGIVSPPAAGELATSHSGKGHIQVRNSTNLHLIGTLNSPGCEAGISCFTLGPDLERVCAAQDETLKFWRVFGPRLTEQRTRSATPPPVSLLEEELR